MHTRHGRGSVWAAAAALPPPARPPSFPTLTAAVERGWTPLPLTLPPVGDGAGGPRNSRRLGPRAGREGLAGRSHRRPLCPWQGRVRGFGRICITLGG